MRYTVTLADEDGRALAPPHPFAASEDEPTCVVDCEFWATRAGAASWVEVRLDVPGAVVPVFCWPLREPVPMEPHQGFKFRLVLQMEPVATDPRRWPL